MTNEIALSFHDSLLRESDIQLLKGPYWLNDQIISFYMEYMEKVMFAKHKKEILFISPEVVQCIKLVSPSEMSIFLDPLNANEKLYIFFPFNDHQYDSVGGTHWSLLIFSRCEMAFYHFDSAGHCNLSACQSFVSRIKEAFGYGRLDNLPLKSIQCFQQQNAYDCGIHVLCNAEIVAQHVVMGGQILSMDAKLNQNCVRTKRREILELIYQLAAGSG